MDELWAFSCLLLSSKGSLALDSLLLAGQEAIWLCLHKPDGGRLWAQAGKDACISNELIHPLLVKLMIHGTLALMGCS